MPPMDVIIDLRISQSPESHLIFVPSVTRPLFQKAPDFFASFWQSVFSILKAAEWFPPYLPRKKSPASRPYNRQGSITGFHTCSLFLQCKHILAIYLCRAMGGAQEESVSDQQMSRTLSGTGASWHPGALDLCWTSLLLARGRAARRDQRGHFSVFESNTTWLSLFFLWEGFWLVSKETAFANRALYLFWSALGHASAPATKNKDWFLTI